MAATNPATIPTTRLSAFEAMVGRAPLLLLAYIVELGASADMLRLEVEYNAGGRVGVVYGAEELGVVLLEYWTEVEVEDDGYETGGTDGDE